MVSLMRLLHTSDWHLGIALGQCSREEEHKRFLNWLLETLKDQAVDALLITGDIFDTANPPATAQRLYYDFLAQCHSQLPELDIVIIGGNHDSAGRLDAPAELLNRLRVWVIGGLVTDQGDRDFERLVVPLSDKTGKVAAWCVAVPFIRPLDVGAAADFRQGAQELYQKAFACARQKRQPEQALVATGHAFLVGGSLSDTERPIQCGYLNALPAALFPDDVAYVALGHLHKAQTVAGRASVRYSGSPLPLSFTERNYEHQVVLVDLEGEKTTRIEPILIPQTRQLLRIPSDRSAAPLEAVLAQLRQLQAASSDAGQLPPLVEVHVQLDRPQPTLKNDTDQALASVWAQLARIEIHWQQAAPHLTNAYSPNGNTSLTPEAMFRACYRTKHNSDPPEDLQKAFQALLEEIQPQMSP
ncbi:MAG: exonuclease subunit SbcD [Acidobacteriota bacterium]